jgi:hypothetical protein
MMIGDMSLETGPALPQPTWQLQKCCRPFDEQSKERLVQGVGSAERSVKINSQNGISRADLARSLNGSVVDSLHAGLSVRAVGGLLFDTCMFHNKLCHIKATFGR